MMRNTQKGISLITVLVGGGVLAFIAVFGLKLVPVFTEYYGIKRAITAVASEANQQTVSVAELRSAFAKRAIVDNVTSVTPGDLDITKDSGQIVISVDYSRRIKIASNVSLLIDFSASSAPGR